MRGRAAVNALGSHIATTAHLSRLTTSQVRHTLLTDPTMWVSTQGQLYAVDPAAAHAVAGGARTQSFAQQMSSTAGGATAPGDVFNLHSDPGAPVEVYLDFTGASVQGTEWNSGYGLPTTPVPAWDPAGDGATTWSSDETNAIYEIWQRVSEDYAPFDVDVTTAPGSFDALHATSPDDPTYGTTVVITSDTAAWATLCYEKCGGIANVGALGQVDPEGRADDAWVFGAGLGESPESVAEAAAHEAGHTFGLTHQGDQPNTDGTSYDLGHHLWAPIMGAGYYHAVTQWAKGEYAGANNSQDELAQMEKVVKLRADEAGGSPSTATAVPSGPAYITDQSDTDVFSLGNCAPNATIDATPAAVGANLDLHLSVVDSTGATIADVDPADDESTVATPVSWASNNGEQVATGLDAHTASFGGTGVAPYFLEVRGGGGEAGGAGDPTADFDTYGSLGAYTLNVQGCDDPATAPSAPTRLTGNVTSTGLVATWQVPANDGGSPISGYQVSVDGGTWNDVSGTSYTDATITTGAHTVAIRAVNGVGAGPDVSTGVQSTTIPGAPQLYGTPQVEPSCSFAENLQCYLFYFTGPTSDGGSPITQFNIYVDGQELTPASYHGGVFTIYGEEVNLEPGYPSDIRITAVNSVGEGAPLDFSGLIPGPPEGIVSGVTTSSDRVARTATITWPDPPFDGGAPVEGFDLWYYPNQPGSAAGPDVVTTGHTWTFSNVKYGGRTVLVSAYNKYGAAFPGGGQITMPPRSPMADPPTNLAVTPKPANGSADISWAPVQIPDPDAVIGYDVCVQNPSTATGEAAAPPGVSVEDGEDTGNMDLCSDGTKATWVTSPHATMTGLSPGAMYLVSVQAVNPDGPGLGVTQLLIENAPAGPVGNLSATAALPSLDSPSVTATWDPPTDLGGASGVAHYEVRLNSATTTGQWQTVWGDTTYTFQPWNTPGLVAGGSYTVDVRADTTGPYSSTFTGVTTTSQPVTVPTTVTPPPAPTPPGQVTGLTAVPDPAAHTVTVTWSPPTDTGTGPIAYYFVDIDGTGWHETSGATSYTLTGVVAGSHTITVEAANTSSLSSLTTVSVVMPTPAPAPKVPGLVTGLKVVTNAARGTATVSWLPPADDGGSPVTGYVVTLGSQHQSVADSVHTVTFTSLKLGTSYAITVTAGNVVGPGAPAHASVLLRTAPGAPKVTVAPGAKNGPLTLTVAWQAAAANGAPVTGYQVRIETLNARGQVTHTATYTAKAAARSLAPTLKAGRYKVSVRAGNAVGWGAFSPWSTTVSPR